MPPIVLPTPRNSNGWLRLPVSTDCVILNTTINTDDELWSALEYYSEVEEVGINLIQTRGLLPQTQHQEIYKYLQAFVRQAKTYYYSAKKLHYRSSSLLYYYSFLNLVKAYLLLRNPNFIMGRTANAVVHGLSYRPSTANIDFRLETVSIKDGIFPLFYEALTNQQIPTIQNFLNVVNLLGYCSDIGYQYETAGFGDTKILPSVATITVDQGTNQAWTIIGIPAKNNILDPFLTNHGNFLTDFQEISLPPTPAGRIDFNNKFDMPSNELNKFRFFQDITTIPMAGNLIIPQVHIDKIINALTPHFNFHYYAENRDFDLPIPYSDAAHATAIPMNEVLGIYIVMFYLSSLVRYRPNYLESLLNYKPSWLIESFVKSTPETFLRTMVSKIVGRDLILRTR